MGSAQAKDQAELLRQLAQAIADDGSVDPATLAVPDVAGAYAVQAALFERGGYALKGFKLSLRDGVTYSAPLRFVESGHEYRFVPGFIVEIELALTLGRDLPSRATPYSREDILDAIGKVSFGVELARSRYLPGATWPLGLADFLSGVGYLVGDELDRSLLEEGADLGFVSVQAHGSTLFDAPAKHPDADPLAALIAYANGMPGPLGPLKAGQVITTGSLCGAVRVGAPAAIRLAAFGKEYAFKLS